MCFCLVYFSVDQSKDRSKKWTRSRSSLSAVYCAQLLIECSLRSPKIPVIRAVVYRRKSFHSAVGGIAMLITQIAIDPIDNRRLR